MLRHEKWWVESWERARHRSPRGMYSVTSMIWSPAMLAPRNCTMLTWRSDFRMATSLRKRCCSLGLCPVTNFTATGVLPCQMPLYTCNTEGAATLVMHQSGSDRTHKAGVKPCLEAKRAAQTCIKNAHGIKLRSQL